MKNKEKKKPEGASADGGGVAKTRPSNAPKAADTFAAKYMRFLTTVMKLNVREVQGSNVDPMLALNNLRTGVDSLRKHEDSLRGDPTVAWNEVFELTDLGEAYVYAAEQVSTNGVATADEIESVRAKLQKLRVPALLFARGLAVLEEERPWTLRRVEEIEAGRGLIDMGRDALALARLYRSAGESIEGKHPLTPARLQEMEEHGEWMLRNVTPDGARTAPEESSDAANIRDRFWTEIVRRHRQARAAGLKVFGEDFGQYVPALGSRVVGTRKTAESPVAPPAPDP